MKPVLVTPPAEDPVTVSELKSHARITAPDEDDLLIGYLAAAVAHLDARQGILGRCIIDQTWRQDYAGWGTMRLPFPDVSSASVTYLDADGVTQTLLASEYELIETAGVAEVVLRRGFSAPRLSADARYPVSVTFTAGFGGSGDVPQAIKLAIMQLAAHWYGSREAVSGDAMRAVPLAYDALIAPYRRVVP